MKKHLLHPTQHTRLRHIRHIDEDIISRVAVQRCTETFLVKVVTDEADTASEHEQAIQCADLNVFLGFFGSERTAIAEEVDEAHSDASVDVEDELKTSKSDGRRENWWGGKTYSVFLRSGHFLDGKGVVQ